MTITAIFAYEAATTILFNYFQEKKTFILHQYHVCSVNTCNFIVLIFQLHLKEHFYED